LLALDNPISAFYLDRVVVTIGRTIDAEIEEATEGAKTRTGAAGKAQMVLNRWMRTEGKARYRDPAAK